MEKLSENKLFLAIILAGFIIGAAIYFSNQSKEPIVESSVVSKQNCTTIPELPTGVSKLATKIIDGDTFIIEGGYSVRILGIDADERDHPCYDMAKDRLEELILNKEVKLEKGIEDKDQWCRYLRYVFLDNKNIGLELVKEGLAVARFSPEDVKYKEEIATAEKEARENKIGCKWGERKTEDEGKVEFQWEKLTTELTDLKVIGACNAGNYINKEVIVEGKIVNGQKDSKSNNVFLDLEKSYPNQCFTAFIYSPDLVNFPENPQNYYKGKTIRIRGVIKEYKGKSEIILRSLSQIEVGK